MVAEVRRGTMLDQPPEQPRVKFLSYAMVKRCFALSILIVDVRASLGKKLRRLQSLPAPAGEERRDADDDVDASARIDQQLQIRDVLPPSGGKQSSARRRRGFRPAGEQELDQRGVSRTGNREKQRCARVAANRRVNIRSEENSA